MFALTALALLAALVPAGLATLRGEAADRAAALQLASVLVTLALVVVSRLDPQPGLDDLGLSLALMSFGGGLVFARFLERWL
ncbi:MAG TPA: monovalent cation/H+ antiporter complex subunit F [Anaeromyxobacteraceae bacterium]|nr:monovalent cation/H+ antiporter complex subunit F [Anaeromyxobacteraceae bacterium]